MKKLNNQSHTDYIHVPLKILKMSKEIVMVVDVMFVKGLPFIMSVSRRLKVTTSEHAQKRTKKLLTLVNKTVNMYQYCEMKVSMILTDRDLY